MLGAIASSLAISRFDIPRPRHDNTSYSRLVSEGMYVIDVIAQARPSNQPTTAISPMIASTTNRIPIALLRSERFPFLDSPLQEQRNATVRIRAVEGQAGG